MSKNKILLSKKELKQMIRAEVSKEMSRPKTTPISIKSMEIYLFHHFN